MGRATSGVIGMRFTDGDQPLGMYVVTKAPTSWSRPVAVTLSECRPTSTRFRVAVASAW